MDTYTTSTLTAQQVLLLPRKQQLVTVIKRIVTEAHNYQKLVIIRTNTDPLYSKRKPVCFDSSIFDYVIHITNVNIYLDLIKFGLINKYRPFCAGFWEDPVHFLKTRINKHIVNNTVHNPFFDRFKISPKDLFFHIYLAYPNFPNMYKFLIKEGIRVKEDLNDIKILPPKASNIAFFEFEFLTIFEDGEIYENDTLVARFDPSKDSFQFIMKLVINQSKSNDFISADSIGDSARHLEKMKNYINKKVQNSMYKISQKQKVKFGFVVK